MGRRKDPCWEHAKNLSTGSDVSFQCNYCSVKYKGGASRLKAHLSGKKNCGIGPCPKVPDYVGEKLSSHKRASPDMENETMSCSLPSSLDRNVRPRVLEEKKDNRWVNDKLVSLLTVSCLPRRLVKSSIFSDFVKAVAQYGSDYELPDLDALFDGRDVYCCRVEGNVNKVKKFLLETGCTLVVDKKGLYTYLPRGVLYQLTTMEGCDDGTEGSDDRTIRFINACVESIGPTKILQIFFDHTSVGSSLKNSLICRYQWMNVGNSPAYEILGLLGDIFELKRLRQILDLAHAITTEMDGDWTRFQVDEEKYRGAFGSCTRLDFDELRDKIDDFWRLKTLLKFRDEDQNSVVVKPVHDKNWYVDHLIHCKEFWIQVNEWVSVVGTLFEALFFTSNKMYPTSGYFCQIMEKVKVAIANCYPLGQDDLKILVYLFDKFQSKVMHPMYLAAALLNPAYICSRSFREIDVLAGCIDFIVRHLVEIDERARFQFEFLRYREKDPHIFTAIAESACKMYNPGTWWKIHGSCIPTLQKYAIRIVSQPCNSIYCHELNLKRNFAQNYQNGTDETMMENFEELETQTSIGIDISNPSLPEWLTEYGIKRSLDRYKTSCQGDLLDAESCMFCQSLLWPYSSFFEFLVD